MIDRHMQYATPLRLRRTGWLSLAAVVFFQLSYAGHEVQHSLTDLGDACVMCLQLDQNAASTPAALPAAVAPVTASDTGTPPAVVGCRKPSGLCESRGPPQA